MRRMRLGFPDHSGSSKLRFGDVAEPVAARAITLPLVASSAPDRASRSRADATETQSAEGRWACNLSGVA